VSLLEQADLDASSDLAFDYIMAVSDFGFSKTTTWDNHINTARPKGQFKTDVGAVPGYYVFYDIYGWC